MKTLSKKQKLEILSNLYWDLNISAEEIYNHLYGKARDGDPLIDEVNLYRRMLTTLAEILFRRSLSRNGFTLEPEFNILSQL